MATTALPDLLSYRDLKWLGMSRHRFDQLLEAGEYERIAPGLFLRADAVDDTTAAWMAIAAKKSSLALHDLTDEIPRRSDIAIPRGSHSMAVNLAPMAWHRFATESFAIGQTEYGLPGGLSIGLYSAERTILDQFRLRHEWGNDIAIGALKRWLSGRGNSPSTLLHMSLAFPEARRPLQNALEISL